MPRALFTDIPSEFESVPVSSEMGDQARAALECSRIYVLRRLHVEQVGQAILLRGRVDSYYHKQLAQELVRMAIDGVEVINHIRVVYPNDMRRTRDDQQPAEENGRLNASDASFPRGEWLQ